MWFNKNAKLLKRKEEELEECKNVIDQLERKYSQIIDIDSILAQRTLEVTRAELRLQELNDKYQSSLKSYEDLEKEVNLYHDSLEIGSFGLYEPQFSFESSETYREAIERNYQQQKQLIRNEKAVICNTEWTVSGSKLEGRKMTNQFKKLMLFAFNGECNGLIAKVKWNNATKTKEKIKKAFESINKLGITQNINITTPFLELKLEELALTYEYQQKKYDEKEEQRRIREQMREEEKAQKELETAKKVAEDEERLYSKALQKARAELETTTQANLEILSDLISSLEEKLQEAHNRKERAIALAQLTKVGHIYIISNLGSFGEDVYKIGMTRRLDPNDRIRELGDASVPFQFDIHAIIYSENAPQLEYDLHQKFKDRRLNRINYRKEFFRVGLDEIEAFVKQSSKGLIQFTKLAEAREFRESITLLGQLNKA